MSGGISPAPMWGVIPVHSPAQLSSNAVAVALSAIPRWVSMLRIQLDDTNPANQRALFGDSTISPTSFGLYQYAGDSFDWPFPGPIPVHKIFFYQVGGIGKCNWIGMERG